MFDRKAQIKVIIIGNDGVSRKYWVAFDAQFYDNKYKIDQDAIYQSAEGGLLGNKMVPTIMFRANNVMPISYKTKPSIPDPDEMGSSISRAAWAIAELMRKNDSAMQTFFMILLALACILAGAGAFMGYQNGQKIDKLQLSLSIIQNQTSIQSPNNGLIPGILPTVVPTPAVITIIPTTLPTPTPTSTPQPQIVVI